MIAAPLNPATAKSLGAFYTSAPVADFLARWSLRLPWDTVLDPSFGGGVFLRAAMDRVSQLGGDPSLTVFGVELDEATHGATALAAEKVGVPRMNLRRSDFFEFAATTDERFDAIVGNPPFIRYQQFSGEARKAAQAVVRRQGVRLTELASSWAPFVIGAAGLLHPGGRLGLVVPMELCHAAYGLPVLAYLRESFSSIQFISFDCRLFPALNQDTLLLLADGRGGRGAEMRWKHLADASKLRDAVEANWRIGRARRLDADAIATGRQRLVEQFLPARARELYAELRQHEQVSALGALADVGIGYVTGANDFFHLSPNDAVSRGIPPSFLRKAICRGRALKGLRFTERDWSDAATSGDAGLLLQTGTGKALPDALRRYLDEGERAGIPSRYKCRTRSPWHRVPLVYDADAFLTYMSGTSPRLVANDTKAVAPNTLHVIRMRPLVNFKAHELASAWQSSLTQLSAELEGHAMGGGLLKLEPKEAERVLIAKPVTAGQRDLCSTFDALARHGRPGVVLATADRLLLREGLGLSERDCRTLREATEILRARRLAKGD